MSKKTITDNNEDVSVTTETKEQKFTVTELRNHALKLFGVTQSTYDGATYKLEGKFSVAEMKTHINSWLKKEVK